MKRAEAQRHKGTEMQSLRRTVIISILIFCLPMFCLAKEESAFFRGFNYLRNKQYTRAIRQFELTIKRNPAYLPTYSNLAECYERQEKYDESKEVWKKYVQYAKFYKPAGEKHIELLDKIKEAKSILADVLKEDVKKDTDILNKIIDDKSEDNIINEKKAWEIAEPLLIDVANDQYPMSIIALQAREILGKYYFKNKLYKEAADAYKKILRFYSRDITQEILYNYAISLGHIKEYEDSVKMFIQITENCPITGVEEKKEFRENVMASYLGMANEIAGTEETEDMLKAIGMYQKIEQYYSDTKAYETARKNIMQVEEMLAKRFEREGDEAYVEKDYSQAMKQYKKIKDNCPRSTKYTKAYKYFQKLSRLELSYKNQAFKHSVSSEYEKSFQLCKRLLNEFPDGRYADWAQMQIGCLYSAQKNHRKAISELVKVPKNYPNSCFADDALDRIGVFFWCVLGEKEKALKMFKYLVKNYPKANYADNAQYYIGQIYLEKQDYQKAVISLYLLLKNYPDSNLTSRTKAQIAKIKKIVKKGKK